MRSANASGPMGMLHPFFIMLSISSFGPTPCCQLHDKKMDTVSRQVIASLMYGINSLFAKNPGLSSDLEAAFPILLVSNNVCCRVSSDVWRPVMISTPFITGTGFFNESQSAGWHTMKCMPITRSCAP